MRPLSLLALGLFAYLPLVVADRTSNAHNTPTVCNTEPVATGTAAAQKRVRRGRDGNTHAETVSNDLWQRDLSRRSGVVTYDANCNNAPPANSGYQPTNGFPTMQSVLQQAYADAVTLADAAANIEANSLAFTHYFGGTAPDVQYAHFRNMMSAITGGTPQYFSVQFECSGTTPACAPNGNPVVAVTDATAGGPTDQKVINICTPFWTAASTKYLLYDSTKPAAVPYRDNSNNGWCGKDNQGNSRRVCQWYPTAGTSILHELTHLDSLGTQAGLQAPTEGGDIGRHGTDDVQTGCEFTGARNWLTQYQGDSSLTSPDYNAESYAAAATELYFMNLCNFTEIRPLVRPPPVPAASASAASTPTPTPVAPPPAYATGTCSFHLQEWQDCANDSSNLFAIVKMVDNDKNDIGDTQTDPTTNPLGDPINTSDPYSFTSKLPLPLVIVGEHEGDYVQFTYGSLSWTSRTTSGSATCSLGGWNPKDGPVCGTRYGNTNAENQMDCSFPC